MTKEDKTMQTVTYEKTPKQPAPEHEYAKLFPLLDGEARQRLVDDIRSNGVVEPIVFLDGFILDGRNRYYAARELLIEYPRVDYEGDDPLAFVISRNMHRRHMTESQRAAAAAKIAKLPPHRPEKGANLHPSVEQAADMMNVSERSVQTAKKVIERGAPQLVAAVDAGKVSVSAAAKVAALPPDEQEDIVAHGKDAILDAAKRIKEQERQERLAKQRENDAAREAARRKMAEANPAVAAIEAAKARNGSRHAAVPGNTPEPVETPEQIAAHRAELLEENEALRKDVAELTRKLATYDDRVALWEKGGLDAIEANYREQIRALEARVEEATADRAKAVRQRDFWKKTAMGLGYVSPNSVVETKAADAGADDWSPF